MSISTCALREEGDSSTPLSVPTTFYFYPRPPRGGRLPERRSWSWGWRDFYPHPPRGGRQAKLAQHGAIFIFLSTPSARRATWRSSKGRRTSSISIHALREEGDLELQTAAQPSCSNFYPRPPRGGRPAHKGYSPPAAMHFYPRSPREGRLQPATVCGVIAYFYPRPPRGGRPAAQTADRQQEQFLSTPSARRATPATPAPKASPANFYPRPPRGGRPPYLTAICSGIMISIHALREEGDASPRKALEGDVYFYPRPPRGGRPHHVVYVQLLAGYFYPRPPRGGRQIGPYRRRSARSFLSTPSARRAT